MLRPHHVRQSTGQYARLAAQAWLILVCLVATAYGPSATADTPRYGLPASAAAEPRAEDLGKPLISYRRDGAQTAESVTAGQENQRAPTGASIESSNPLRPTPEPPAEQYALPAERSTPTIQSNVQPLPTNEVLPTLPQAESAASNPFPATAPIFRYDNAIAPASHETTPAESTSPPAMAITRTVDEPETRRLAPPSMETDVEPAAASPHANRGASPFAFSKLESLTTAGTGLAIVVGLFLICMWLFRRGGGKSTGLLPAEAFAVLGRAPLTAQSFAHLLRVGNKLVLVAVTPEGAQPLTEVTDPLEVDRLTALCASGRGHGPAAEFQQVLAQLAREPARGFLGGEATASRRRA